MTVELTFGITTYHDNFDFKPQNVNFQFLDMENF